MGYWSEKLINDEATRQAALGILVETGVLEECENHEGIFFGGSRDLTAAYKLVNFQLTQNGGATPDERRELTDAIKAAFEDNSFADRCEICAEHGP